MKGLSRDHKLIPPQSLRMKRDERFLPFNFTGYMQAFWQSLKGPLRDMNPHDGPMDLWGAIYIPLHTNLTQGIRW